MSVKERKSEKEKIKSEERKYGRIKKKRKRKG